FLSTRPRANTIEFDFTFRLITPMFGGGVEINGPQKPCDPITPIRVPSIRGQLRFWWRACNPAKAETAEELFKAEEALWGSTKEPSKVQIALVGPTPTPKAVNVLSQPEGKTYWRVKSEYEAIAYGLFPLQPPQKPKNDEQRRPGVLWQIDEPITLRLQLPTALQDSVREALNAWALFGGIGGRTRRGFGAVEFVRASCPEFSPRNAPEFLKQRDKRPKIQGVPSLAGATVKTRTTAHSEPRPAWGDALHPLQQFRQGLGIARNGNDPKHPGRSRWPEADQLRRLARAHLARHAPEHTVRKFPRAAFGLPIVFHFKDHDPRSTSTTDPSDMTLVPALGGSKRFSSPLILRPHRRPDNKYEALALVLANTRVPDQVRLEGLPEESSGVTSSLSAQEARNITPLQKHGNANPDVLQAFLHYFESASPTLQPKPIRK
ncbi:MAG TPA: type III-B CRISPR module RAMP protein Cmr1, partial [Nannocystaceae bacterium]|nr:type III-B CRISPR module RAMP protein Cmr1 [Nannocystaceae bacterium]